jgi:hypothetical protein
MSCENGYFDIPAPLSIRASDATLVIVTDGAGLAVLLPETSAPKIAIKKRATTTNKITRRTIVEEELIVHSYGLSVTTVVISANHEQDFNRCILIAFPTGE